MKRVGAFDAKTHLSRLLQGVAQGESVEITRHGVPVARLVPPANESQPVDSVIEELCALRREITPLTRATIREMRDEGRP